MADTKSVMELHRTTPLSVADPDVFAAIEAEKTRQNNHLELIASENIASKAVLEALGSVMTDKYAEGYPGKRYYGGCDCVDVVETLAIDRAKQLFNADHANVQPHSGAQANQGVYSIFMQPGDTLLAMDLSMGGHLTHGSPVNFSGILYNAVHYGVDKKTEYIDMNVVRDLAIKHKPKVIVSGASCYPRTLDFEAFRSICDEVGAYMMVDMAHIAGLVAAGEHPSPVPYADFVTTTTHKTLRGPRGAMILCKEEHAAAVDKAVFPGMQGGPLMHAIAGKAVCFGEALKPSFKSYQHQVRLNASALAAALQARGYRLVSGGTDNHLMLVDLRTAGITGRRAQTVLDKVFITVNRNMIPFDPEKPFVTSGVRLGTPCVTTRGLTEVEMPVIAELIDRVLKNADDKELRATVRSEVKALCQQFPVLA